MGLLGPLENQTSRVFPQPASLLVRDFAEACESFSCAPWIAVYVECDTYAELFLTSLNNYDKYTNTRSLEMLSTCGA